MSETIVQDEGECCVACVNGNHVYNEVSFIIFVVSSLWSASVKYLTLSHALTGVRSSGRH